MQLARGAHARALLQAKLQPSPIQGCSRGTLRCPDARSYQAELRHCCRDHLRSIVRDAAALLEEHQVTWWADYGTLLGAVRNPLTTWADYPWLSQQGRTPGPLAPGVIPHDKDADFGALWADWGQLMRVRAGLERLGYDVLVRPQLGNLKIRLSAINHTNLDIFTWRRRPSGALYRVHYISVDAYKGRDIPAGALEPRGTVEWEGLALAAPVNPEAFCAFRYGPAWRKPVAANHDGVRR